MRDYTKYIKYIIAYILLCNLNLIQRIEILTKLLFKGIVSNLRKFLVYLFYTFQEASTLNDLFIKSLIINIFSLFNYVDYSVVLNYCIIIRQMFLKL